MTRDELQKAIDECPGPTFALNSSYHPSPDDPPVVVPERIRSISVGAGVVIEGASFDFIGRAHVRPLPTYPFLSGPAYG